MLKTSKKECLDASKRQNQTKVSAISASATGIKKPEPKARRAIQLRTDHPNAPNLASHKNSQKPQNEFRLLYCVG